MTKVLFVCLGNICRSPLAEGIFQHKADERGLSQVISSDSCGTAAYHIGELPDRRSVEVAKSHGIFLNHFGRQFNSQDFEAFDYILAMDESNFYDIKQTSGYQTRGLGKVHKMLDFDAKESGDDVPDPYYGGPDGFQHVFDLLETSTSNLLDKIVKDHKL